MNSRAEKPGRSPVRALSFDFDETLLDGGRSEEAVLRTCQQISTQVDVDAARLFEANREVWKSYWPEVEEKWTLGSLSGLAVSLEAWREALAICGSNDDSLARMAMETHSNHRRDTLRLFDDVPDLFNFLKPRFRLALITNGASDTQRGRLRLLGIENLFDAVIVSGELGIAKPDLSIFTLALDKLGVKPQNIWHVGDSLKTDVAGALNAGITAVWLNRAGVPRDDGDPKPDYEIHSLSQIPTLLSRI